MVKTACPGEKWAKRGLMRRCHASGHVMTLGLQISKCGKRGWKVKVKVAQLCLTLRPHGRYSPWKTSGRKGCLSRDQKPWRCGRGGLRDDGDRRNPPGGGPVLWWGGRGPRRVRQPATAGTGRGLVGISSERLLKGACRCIQHSN